MVKQSQTKQFLLVFLKQQKSKFLGEQFVTHAVVTAVANPEQCAVVADDDGRSRVYEKRSIRLTVLFLMQF